MKWICEMNDIEDDGFITVYPKIALPQHGSPQDRGSADAYYGRPFDPHWWPEGTGIGKRVEKEDMTIAQIFQYTYGYETETDRKDWG
jgi:hypothetical protein